MHISQIPREERTAKNLAQFAELDASPYHRNISTAAKAVNSNFYLRHYLYIGSLAGGRTIWQSPAGGYTIEVLADGTVQA